MIFIAILIFILVGIYVLNSLYKRTNHYRNQFVDIFKIQDSVKEGEKFQIVNLGSNHPKFGFDYTVVPELKGANWAVGPETFEYDFAILRRFCPYLVSGAVVLIPICLKKFFLLRQNFRPLHRKYYACLTKTDIVDFSLFEKLRYVDYPLLFNPKLLKFLIRDCKKDSRLDLKDNPLNTQELLQKDADYWIDCWDKEFNISSISMQLTDKHRADIAGNIRILQNMIAFCINEGLNPVLCILPVTNYLSSKFPKEYLQEHFYNYIDQADVASVPIMDYLSDERFTDPSLYINSFFFNQTGRRKFTKTIIDDLKNKSIL